MPELDVERLLADEERGWLALTEVFGDVPIDRFDEPSVTEEGWSPMWLSARSKPSRTSSNGRMTSRLPLRAAVARSRSTLRR